MDIQARLEQEHSRTLTTAIVNYIGDDKKKFSELMQIFLKGEYRLTQRAAWSVSEVNLEQPQLLEPYFDELVQKLEQPGQHPAIYRNILRIFQGRPIPEEYQSRLLDVCFKFLKNETIAVAIKAFALTVSASICKNYPELSNELQLVIGEMALLPQPPAIRHRLKLAIKEISSTVKKKVQK